MAALEYRTILAARLLVAACTLWAIGTLFGASVQLARDAAARVAQDNHQLGVTYVHDVWGDPVLAKVSSLQGREPGSQFMFAQYSWPGWSIAGWAFDTPENQGVTNGDQVWLWWKHRSDPTAFGIYLFVAPLHSGSTPEDLYPQFSAQPNKNIVTNVFFAAWFHTWRRWLIVMLFIIPNVIIWELADRLRKPPRRALA